MKIVSNHLVQQAPDFSLEAQASLSGHSTETADLPKPSVCAVMVTYQPTASLLDNVAALRPQTDALVIVDNGSNAQAMRFIEEAGHKFGCVVFRNGHNLGIAAALNRGVRYARSRRYEWVALFDQDSSVPGSFMSSMLRTAMDRNKSQVAIIAPQYLDRSSSVAMPLAKDRKGNILTSMTSGSLIPVELFRRCGEFDESLFMDYVDHEFCLRVRNMGFVIVQSPEARLLHSLGTAATHHFLGRTFLTTNHRAERRYYITRNRVWLYKEYFSKDISWTLKDARSLLGETVKILLAEDSKIRKMGNILRGVKDALAGRLGHRVPL